MAPILRGPPHSYPKIEKGIGEFFFEQAEKYSDRIFQIDGDTGEKETYRDAKSKSTKLAIFMQNNGIKSGDIVVLCCGCNVNNLIPALAVQFLGGKVASVDSGQVVGDVKHVLTLLKPIAMVVDLESLEMIEQACRETNQKPFIITIGTTSGKYPNMLEIEKTNFKEESNFRPMKQKGSDVGVIVFSSGTTSTPKGIYLSNFGLLNLLASILGHNNLKPGVFIHFASLYWISAWVMSLLMMSSGGSKVLSPHCTGEKFLELIEKYKITYAFCAAPFTFQLTNLNPETVKQYDTSSFFSMVIGGSTIDPNQVIKLRKVLPHTHINLGYGSSESNYISLHDYSDAKIGFSKEKVGSSGTLVAGLEMKIVDLNSGEILGPNQTGEIRIKSVYQFAGYHDYSNAGALDEDGFIKIGDVGYYDEDGYIYINDRINDMFKCKSKQVSPTVLEKVLLQHPAIQEAIVFAIPHLEDTFHPAASVILRNGCHVTCAELIKFAGAELADHYQLRGGVMIVDSIPKTATGKYQRRDARDIFLKLKDHQ